MVGQNPAPILMFESTGSDGISTIISTISTGAGFFPSTGLVGRMTIQMIHIAPIFLQIFSSSSEMNHPFLARPGQPSP